MTRDLRRAVATVVALVAVTGTARGEFDCVIHPSKVVQLAAPIDGVLGDVLVRPGQRVMAGQVIARIDTELAAAELAAARLRAESGGALAVARARLVAAERRHARARAALEQRVVTEADVEQAEGDLHIARQELARVREDRAVARAEADRMTLVVAKGEIRAPATGIIGETLLNAGESVRGKAVAELIVVEPMRVESYVPLSMVSNIRARPEAFGVIVGDAMPRNVAPTFDYIAPTADASSSTVRVFYSLTDASVLPGMPCRLVSSGAKDTLGHGTPEDAASDEFAHLLTGETDAD